MMEQLQNLGNPQDVSEHFISHIGLSNAINGKIGKSINPEEPLVSIKDNLDKNVKLMSKHAENIFGESSPKSESEEHNNSLHELHDVTMNHSYNPQLLGENLTEQLNGLAQHDPELSASIPQSIGKALAFLDSKRPVTGKQKPLDSEPSLSQHQISTFNRYASIIDNPLNLFKHVKDGTVMPEHMEAINTVYPALLNNMKLAVQDKMADYLAKHDPSEITYNKKISLSHLLGEPLDSTMTQQGLMANQIAFHQMNQQKAQQEAAKQASFSKSGMSKMKVNDMTRAERAQNRR